MNYFVSTVCLYTITFLSLFVNFCLFVCFGGCNFVHHHCVPNKLLGEFFLFFCWGGVIGEFMIMLKQKKRLLLTRSRMHETIYTCLGSVYTRLGSERV